MKNITIPILVAVIFVVMVVYLVTFQVRETESAFVTRFGKPVRELTKPGLYVKWPTPIEQVNKFDSRLRVLEAGQLSETTTKGAVPIILNTYVVWRVAEPLALIHQQLPTSAAPGIRSTMRIIPGYRPCERITLCPPSLVPRATSS